MKLLPHRWWWLGALLLHAFGSVGSGAPLISEFMAANKSALADVDGTYSDWIEIWNPDPTSVNLAGYGLTDNQAVPLKWIFPAVTLAPNSYLVVFASGKNRAVAGSQLHTNFQLATSGEYLALTSPGGTVVDEFAPPFPAQKSNLTYGIGLRTQSQDRLAASVPQILIPASSAALPPAWNSPAYTPDGTWASGSGPGGIGYDRAIGPGGPPGIRNLAPTGTATQSSTLGGFIAAFGNDSVSNNFTHTLNTDHNATWTLDLNGRALIYQITINNRGDGCCQYRLRDITLEILEADGATVVWTSPLLNPENTDSSPQLLDVDVEGLAGGAVLGKYVRVKRAGDPDFSGQGGIAGSQDDAYVLSIGEINVQGESISNYDGFIKTDIELSAFGQNASAFARYPLNVPSAADIATMKLQVRYDDGFIAYLNGSKIAERNTPVTPTWNSSATVDRDDSQAYQIEEIDVSAFKSSLVNGPNLLAIQMLNNVSNDEDFLFQPKLITSNIPQQVRAFLGQPTPGAVNNVPYYLDRVSDTSFSVKRGIYNAPFQLAITCLTPGSVIRYTTDGTVPTESTGTIYSGPISIATTAIVRAAAFKPEWQPTNVDTHTYIFPSQLFGSSVMNQSSMTDPAYQSRLMPALNGLPMISLVFSGEITRAERATSMELIGFGNGNIHEDCGMAQFGSYVTNFAKQSMRLYFRDQYGASKLKYPLFAGLEHDLPAAEDFDALDLRQCSHDMVDRGYYLSGAFCDDSLLDMGHLNPHGRFIHIMVNGQYWGIYHLRERWNSSMHSEYLGGQAENYEAMVSNKGGGPWSPTVPYDGTGAFWNTMLTKRSDWLGIQPYLDSKQFLDFMLLFMSGDCEAEHRAVGPNTIGSGFQFYLNDADGWTRYPSERTLNEGPDDIMLMLRNQGHPDYKATLADQIQRHYFNDGAMTTARLLARHDARATELEIPFVLESARWGYRTVDSWVAARDSYRNSILTSLNTTMVGRFRTNGLLPATFAPVLSQHGGNVASGYEVTMSGTAGLIYFTTNNTDPRLSGGAVSPGAKSYQSAATSMETLIPTGAIWKYRDLGEALGASNIVLLGPPPLNNPVNGYGSANWKHPSFSDVNWSSGAAELGYGAGPVTTVGYGGNSASKFITTHFRRHFNLTNKDQLSALTMRIKRDDGAIVYINGWEAARPNMTAGTVYFHNTLAPTSVPPADNDTFFSFPSLPLSLLKEGDNVIAVEMHQFTAGSTDLSFDLELTATRTTTGSDRLFLTSNTIVKARALSGTTWSGLVEAFFTVDGAPAVSPGEVTISEIHYNPSPGLETEFVELMNISDHAINLRGCRLSAGFPCRFPAARDTLLAPGQRTVMAKSLWDINTTYGLGKPVAALAPKSNLNNGGELLTLADSTGAALRGVLFDTKLPWPHAPDGTGPSLTLSAPMANPDLSNPMAWRSSFVTGGTPGSADTAATYFTGNPTADSNSNGYSDLLEYAFANNRLTPAVLPVPSIQTLDVGGIQAPYLTLNFRLNTAAADVVLEPASSTDLDFWSPANMNLHERTDNPDGTTTFLLRSEFPVNDESIPRLFLRLQARQ